jgi:hypothetical protein
MQKSEEWTYWEDSTLADPIESINCAFAMMDVMGYKAKLNGSDRTAEFARFLELREETDSVFGANFTGGIEDFLKIPGQHFLLYSDTLIFYQPKSNEILPCDALVSASVFSMRVIAAGLERGFLLRGAIAYGELLRSGDSIAGPVVNECAEHYEATQWAGCHICPSGADVLDNAPKSKKERVGKYFEEIDVPFRTKTGLIVPSKRWAVNWIMCQSRILPPKVDSIIGDELKQKMREYGAKGNMSDGVIAYFAGLLHKYAKANPEADEKVRLTLQVMAPSWEQQ